MVRAYGSSRLIHRPRFTLEFLADRVRVHLGMACTDPVRSVHQPCRFSRGSAELVYYLGGARTDRDDRTLRLDRGSQKEQTLHTKAIEYNPSINQIYNQEIPLLKSACH